MAAEAAATTIARLWIVDKCTMCDRCLTVSAEARHHLSPDGGQEIVDVALGAGL